MEQKIKKLLSFGGFLVLTSVFLFFPTHQAQAIPLVGAAVVGAVVTISGWIMQLLSFMSAAIVVASAAVLQWILTLPWKYTSGGIVDVGWPIVRNLANISFVVILVAIGLGTALRIEGYQVAKTLRNLVVIILLVNFTPVIIGLIVDASNIIMNFFIGGENFNPGAYFNAHMSAQRSVMPPNIWEKINIFSGGNFQNLLGGIIIIGMDFVIAFIFQVFGFLFLVRYIAIWILVILSPIAFASYILPATRKMWKMWWDQLFQWSIIGVSAGFFLYLGTMFLSKLDEITPPKPQGLIGASDVLVSLMPLITVALFYVIGLYVSLSTSAHGAKQITAAAKKGGKAAGTVIGKTAWRTGATGPIKGVKAYNQARKMGFSRRDAFGELNREVKRSILPKPISATQDASWRKTIAKGSWNAIKDTAKAGWNATWGVKAKKSGKKQCPNCKKMIAANAKSCPTMGCGYSFE